MGHSLRSPALSARWTVVVAGLLAVWCSGCEDGSSSGSPASQKADSGADGTDPTLPPAGGVQWVVVDADGVEIGPLVALDAYGPFVADPVSGLVVPATWGGCVGFDISLAFESEDCTGEVAYQAFHWFGALVPPADRDFAYNPATESWYRYEPGSSETEYYHCSYLDSKAPRGSCDAECYYGGGCEVSHASMWKKSVMDGMPTGWKGPLKVVPQQE